jgi:hypothetical protein
MGKKPETLEQRMAADPDLAEVLGGFREEMLASINRRKKAAEVVQFPPKLSEQEPLRRKQVIDQALERLNEQRRQQGLPSLEMARQMRNSLEVVPAPAKKVVSEYDPMKKFGEGCHRGPLDSDSDL